MILIAVICTNSYDYKTFISGFQFAEGVNIQFKAVVTAHDAEGQGFAGYYLTPAAASRPDAEDLVAMVDARLRMPSAVDPWDYNPNSVRKPYERRPDHAVDAWQDSLKKFISDTPRVNLLDEQRAAQKDLYQERKNKPRT